MADTYTYDIAQAGYDLDQIDEKGEVDFDGFVREFRAFPWLDQVGLNWNTGKSEPTIAVRNRSVGTILWVSIAKDREENVWLVGCTYPKMKKGLFGLGSEREVRWVEIFVVEQAAQVEWYFQRYFKGEGESLLKSLRQHDLFAEAEAPD